MKIQKFNENSKEIKTADILTEMFFGDCDELAFSKQTFNVVNNKKFWYFRLIFAFGFIRSGDLEQIQKNIIYEIFENF